MNVLLVTEKCHPHATQRDGGARLVETLKRAFGRSLSVMQFGPTIHASATWHFEYPFDLANRFERRLANADFIAEQVKAVEHDFTHVIFIHVSMQFGLIDLPLRQDIRVWTFPMFLTPSYLASGEKVPENYIERERLTLVHSKHILTPSYLEKRQLIEFYSVPEERIHVIPRGIETSLLNPKVRFLDGPPKFCSIGSIKPQKNTVGLIRLFANIRAKFPGATLHIIGPIQNHVYGSDVCREIQQLGLSNCVELAGPIAPHQLALTIQDRHFHLSTSMCETFGRSIFETLASGLPNIVRAKDNAAAEFLEHLPYIRFVKDEDDALKAIEEMLVNFSLLSSTAIEIGRLYDDEILSRLLSAKIAGQTCLAISDFDGTLFHKEDPLRTLRCIENFRRFPLRVICSARPLHDLLEQLDYYQLDVDWIIGYSGAMVSNGAGKVLWHTSLDREDVPRLEKLIPQAKRIEFENQVLQLTAPLECLPMIEGVRIESYQNFAFIAHWEASKFRAVHRLLSDIQWSGQVCVFGDGPYDKELLNYFDGTLITSSPQNNRQKKELEYA